MPHSSAFQNRGVFCCYEKLYTACVAPNPEVRLRGCDAAATKEIQSMHLVEALHLRQIKVDHGIDDSGSGELEVIRSIVRSMIAKLIVYKCRNCGSQNIVKSGNNASGSQQYWCKECGKRGVVEPKRGYSEAQKEQILFAYYERSSMRGIQRTFGVSRPTLAAWLKKRQKQSET